MTTNLFVIANVKQLRTGGSLKFYCLFSEHLGGVVLNSVIINSFHNRVEFGTILEGLRNFGGGGGGALNPPTPTPLGTPLASRNFTLCVLPGTLHHYTRHHKLSCSLLVCKDTCI